MEPVRVVLGGERVATLEPLLFSQTDDTSHQMLSQPWVRISKY